MIRHILLLNIKEGVDGRSKAESIAAAKELLDSVRGKVPGLIGLEVGEDFSATNLSADMIMSFQFESREALEAYSDHSANQVIAPFMMSIMSDCKMIDYEI